MKSLFLIVNFMLLNAQQYVGEDVGRKRKVLEEDSDVVQDSGRARISIVNEN
jgi:hypothetical protein